MFVTEAEMKALQLIEKRNKLMIKQIDEEGNEVERKQQSDRFGRGRSRFGRSGGGRRFGSSRFGEDTRRSRFSSERSFGEKRERGTRSRFPKAGGEKRQYTDSSFGARPDHRSSMRSAGRGKPSRFERPSTKDLMKDFLPNTKPERGSYWGRE